MGIGIPELIIILLVIFLFVGPKKLPEAGESLGKALKAFKKDVYSGDKSKESNEAKTAEQETAETVKEAETQTDTQE